MLGIEISPPLLNSASPWATSAEELRALYDCAHTGAVTTRTATLSGFAHDAGVHQFAFFDGGSRSVGGGLVTEGVSSLNTLGYSPLPLSEYLDMIAGIVKGRSASKQDDDVNGGEWTEREKPFIVSVTGSPGEVKQCYGMIQASAAALKYPLLMEVNLSCPNIPGRPPPAYDAGALEEYLDVFQQRDDGPSAARGERVPVGIKTPPYTYAGQFEVLASALLRSCRDGVCPIDFITATNTLGSSLLMSSDEVLGTSGPNKCHQTRRSWKPSISSAAGTGVGGLAGAGLHQLALGNVATLRRVLDQTGHPHRSSGDLADSAIIGSDEEAHARSALARIEIIGVGGVSDRNGYERMLSAGASYVAVATALGIVGPDVFQRILG